MKRTMISVLCVMLLMVNSVFAVDFKDVKESHWAYDAIDNLVSKGLITGFQDGTFKGKNNLNRYEYATLTHKLIQKIEKGEIKLSQLSTGELANLERLVIEFADELSVLNSKVEKHEERITRLENALASGKKIDAKVVETTSSTVSSYDYDDEDEIIDEERVREDSEWIANFDKQWSIYLGATLFEPDSMSKVVATNMNAAGAAATGTKMVSSDNFFDNEVSFMGGIRYGIDKNWMIDFRYMNYENDKVITDDNNVNYTFISDLHASTDNTAVSANHNLTVKPMTLTAYYYFNNENRKFRPFVGLGAGIYDTELLISEYTDVARTTLYMTTMVSEEITGYHFALGGEYWFNRDWSIRGEGRFVNADETFNLLTDAKFARTGLTHDAIKATLTPKYSGNAANDDLEIDLGGIDVSFSINYFFK